VEILLKLKRGFSWEKSSFTQKTGVCYCYYYFIIISLLHFNNILIMMMIENNWS